MYLLLTLFQRLRVLTLQERDDRNAEAMERMTQLLERICNQNMQKDIISDFKVCSSISSHAGLISLECTAVLLHVYAAQSFLTNACCDVAAGIYITYCVAQLLACEISCIVEED